MKKFIVIVIDSFGIGEMNDVPIVRPQDSGANTCAHIFEKKPDLYLPNFEKLGLINALGFSPNHKMKKNPNALFGTSNLAHQGGDTFMGHQEIMGTKPLPPLKQPFSEVIDLVEKNLILAGFSVIRKKIDNLAYLWVNDSVAIGDNLEADLGQVFNLSANLNQISFEKLKEMGKIVRHAVKVSRVIAFGGKIENSAQIHQAAETKENKFIGISAPKSGLYKNEFQVVHLGFGVDPETQVPAKLHKVGIPTILIGKVADIVQNQNGKSIENLVDSQTIFDLTLKEIEQNQSAFICINIQETDLAGHEENVDRYAERLQLVDRNLEKIIQKMTENDCVIVTADHGNDPTIGHSKHTREKVPILIYQKNYKPNFVGERKTLSDIGATVCEFFDAEFPQNGTSFLSFLNH